MRKKKAGRDALDKRQKRARSKRRRIRMITSMAVMTIMIVILLYYVFGVAYYKGTEKFSGIPSNSGVVYLKLTKEFSPQDIVIFEDLNEDTIWIRRDVDYRSEWKDGENDTTKVLGKVLFFIELNWLIGG